MISKTEKAVIGMTFVSVLMGIAGIFAGYRCGYKDGQLDAARGHLRWSIMDGVVVEFHGLDVDQEANE